MEQPPEIKLVNKNKTVVEDKAHFVGMTQSPYITVGKASFHSSPPTPIYKSESVTVSATLLDDGEYEKLQNTKLSEAAIIDLANALASTFSNDGWWESARTKAFSKDREQMRNLIIANIFRFDGDKFSIKDKVVNAFNFKSSEGKSYAAILGNEVSQKLSSYQTAITLKK